MAQSPSAQVIIGITGTNGAGKGTVVEILMEDLGFKHYSARSLLTKILNEQGKELTRPNMSELANSLRAKNGPAALAEKLLEEAQKDGGRAVIESIRTPGEANMLRAKSKLFQLLAVDAPSKVRYERVVVRGSSTDKIPYEQFVKEEEVEMASTDPNKQNVSKCIEMADCMLVNESTVEALREQLNKYLTKLGIETVPVTPGGAAAATTEQASLVRILQRHISFITQTNACFFDIYLTYACVGVLSVQAIQLHVPKDADVSKVDALVKGSALDNVRSLPGFKEIIRQVVAFSNDCLKPHHHFDQRFTA